MIIKNHLYFKKLEKYIFWIYIPFGIKMQNPSILHPSTYTQNLKIPSVTQTIVIVGDQR
jgi:hypothetical protein